MSTFRNARTQWRCEWKVSARQVEVLALVSQGLNYEEVGARLRITTHTVAHHVAAMGRVLAASNRPALVAIAITTGLLDAEHWPAVPSGKLCGRLGGSCACSTSRIEPR
ncbi:helix-turn-helix transcriptional regulator [Leifsonia sp. C5G2]|nr:helix-turn-helix transcriptional regulator [Leifsonia sp. C5G2]